MTTKDKIARRKLSLLELATDLDNLSKACKIMGYSRQQFLDFGQDFNCSPIGYSNPMMKITRNMKSSRRLLRFIVENVIDLMPLRKTVFPKFHDLGNNMLLASSAMNICMG